MNLYRPAKRLLVLLALTAPTAGAAANIGATARATISISIVIPPHVVIAAGPSLKLDGSANDRHRLCVDTNRFRGYHLTLVTGAQAIDQGQIVSSVPTAACAPAAAADEMGAAYIDSPAKSAGEPLTLFVVPD